MSLSAERLVDATVSETGLDDFGGDSFREGLDRLVDALEHEAELSDLGRDVWQHRISTWLCNRLRVQDTHRRHPDIAAERVDAPIFVLGLPRTGTTALSQLLSADPQIRSVRLWESLDPVPPPETATEQDDPRIASAQAGLDAMYETFPKMRALYFQTATGATECQDLLGMELRTAHFDGMARVPSYTSWVVHEAAMVPAYRWHRCVLQLLQWRCPPKLWHLKTPVHLLALDALSEAYPDARFVWTHRDPAAVLGSVCSLIAFTRGMTSQRDDSALLGAAQLALWAEAIDRGMRFRDRVGDDRFADVPFDRLNGDPVGTVEHAYDGFGLSLGAEARSAMARWAEENRRGSRGTHEYALVNYGLDAAQVRERFAAYLERFDVPRA